MSSFRRYAPAFTLAAAIVCLYLYHLGAIGVIDPDEPRYLAIGHAMARTGDYITPRLWGAPWFEKPPLLYWETAFGALAGLGPELAGRVPVVLSSLAFLVAMFGLLRREFGKEAAGVAVFLLATSAGWLTYSSLALTDLLLAVFYSLTVLLVLPLVRPETEVRRNRLRLIAAGACLGLAALAKGLVPLALAVPLAWYLRKHWRDWWLSGVACFAVAGPWYVAVYLRNGYPFIQEFFWKHHFERLYSASLQHVQPWYFYVPVLLAALFPWTPLLALLLVRRSNWDERRKLLAGCVVFGFLLFSFSVNKLPGYLLPLLPAVFALVGGRFENFIVARLSRLWLALPALLIGLIPLVAQTLPQTLALGRMTPPHLGAVSKTGVFYLVAPIAAVVLSRRSWSGVLLVLCLVSGGLYLKIVTFPVLERTVSARGLWQEIQGVSGSVCDAGMNRDWAYGLAFYRGAPLPPCRSGRFGLALRSQGHERPALVAVR